MRKLGQKLTESFKQPFQLFLELEVGIHLNSHNRHDRTQPLTLNLISYLLIYHNGVEFIAHLNSVWALMKGTFHFKILHCWIRADPPTYPQFAQYFKKKIITPWMTIKGLIFIRLFGPCNRLSPCVDQLLKIFF